MLDTIKIKYSRLGIEVRAALWYVVCNVIQKVVIFICTPIYTRFLSQEQYGEFTLYQSWYSIFIVLCTFNLFYSGYTAGITRFENDSNRYTSSSVWLSIIFTIVIGSLSVAINYSFNLIQINNKYFVAMFAEIIGFSAYNFYVAYQRYYFKYNSVILISIGMTVFMSILSTVAVVILPQKKRLDGRIYVEVMTWFIVGMVCIAKTCKGNIVIYDKFYWKYGLRNNIPLIPHYLSSTILNQSDRIMISKIEGLEKAGLYGLAYSMSMFLTAISAAIQNAFNPFLFRQIKKRETCGIKEIINGLVVIMTLLCEMVILVAPEVIRIMTPKEYWGVEYVMVPIVCAVFFIYLYGVFSAVEHFFGKTITIMMVSIICAIINILLNIWLIPIYGYIAAGYTTLFCYVLLALLHMLISKKVLRKKSIDGYCDERFIVFFSILNICLSVGISFLYNRSIIRYGILLITFIGIMFNQKKIRDILKSFR